ncbi:FAD-dependent oxidoreductase [Nocardioides cynanchi]|uniref:FAD-dependent oxidoreductase n=1 Tax=Nocardioides cynanchi TaxID=2558918 RepID=UPI00192E2709|nr:FAD-dependent oxidoreductase [Nocardioides cynanchi]
MTPARRIAVIGSGVAGLTAAHIAAKTADVTLFEADTRLGGHADTHEVDGLAIDTGFIVHNRRTYPTLIRLFDELGVTTQTSEMSMSVRDEEAGLEYAGALGASGLFPTWRNLARPRFLRMLTEVPRFHRRARALLETPAAAVNRDQTLRDFLSEGRFSAYFGRHFMEPLVAAVWSCDPEVALDYPARYLFEFLSHHGMLAITGSPEWRTVAGGSREYVAKVAAALPDVRLGTKVTSVRETPTGVEVTDGNGRVTSYDAAIIATHPDQALAMLESPTPAQRQALVAIPYSDNPALLHTDESLLPREPRARASWNFLRPRVARAGVTVTYDLTRLQRLPTQTRYLVTLGAGDGTESLVDPSKVIARMEYAHPLYTPASVAAQRQLPDANTERLAFAGAYHGWGFHEDGARSGAAAATHLGLAWPEQTHAAAGRRSPETGMFDTRIRHVRRRPFKRSFDNRAHTWMVDLDDLPDHGLLGRFEGRDHLGSPERGIRANVDAFLSAHGIDLTGGRVLMAANARAFGYCFNPISVFWCFDRHHAPAGVIVEVHNTYGDRHAYLVHPDERGRARADKKLYVSPFHGTDGWYDLSVPVPGDELLVSVTLHTDDGAAFSVTQTGQRTTTNALRAAPQAIRGAVAIRTQGIWLWARRLPIQPRPDHHQEGVR